MAIALPAARRLLIERFVKFGAVGVAGLGINLLVQAALTEGLGINYVAAAILATQVSSTANYLMAEHWVFAAPTSTGRLGRYLAFLGMNNAALLLRVPMMWVLTSVFGVHYSISNLISLTALMLIRFGLADTVIWRAPAPDALDPDPVPDALATSAVGPSSQVVQEPTPVVSAEVPEPVATATHEARRPAADEADVGEVVWARPFPYQGWLLAGVVLVGTILRTWRLTAVGFNSDEAVYAGQAAAIAGDPDLSRFFPVIRAHPLLFQGLLSIPYHLGTSELVGRLASAAFGVGTIVVAYLAAKLLYGSRAALVTALVVALMPYQVIVNRQVLLDGPTAFFATLALYFVARYALKQHPGWLIASAGALGLTVLSKETYIVLVASMFAFLALSPTVRVRFRDVVLAVGVFVAVVVPFPLIVVLAGKSDTGTSYLSWQLFRRPNHTIGFYATTIPWYVGPLVLAAAVAALVIVHRTRAWSWREWLLLSWSVVPIVFFQLWPVKGFHYLLAATVPLAILGAYGLVRSITWLRADERGSWRRAGAWAGAALVVVLALSLAVPAWTRTQTTRSGTLLAGAGGVPGGREAGTWIAENVPAGAEIITVGPSMANLVQFYGQRKAYGLSVSPNPLNRNPAYDPLRNPDLALRSGQVQYAVWDAYSRTRSSYFSDRLTSYVDRYYGRPVFTYESHGEPTIVVYEVRP